MHASRPIRLGTRGSSLAVAQARIVQTILEQRATDRVIERVVIQAQADKDSQRPLTEIAGEGIFVKELEIALQDNAIDVAVHSLKDLPLDLPQGLSLAAVLKREEPRDALVSRGAKKLADLPIGSRVGTSSLRRRSQLLHARRDLKMIDIRGNVDSRLRKLDEGQYDAIVVAACGLIRLGLEDRITEFLGLDVMLPEPGQGALALEAREDDPETLELLQPLGNKKNRACVEAERAFLRALGGGCRVPIAAYASYRQDTLELDGMVARPDGTQLVRGQTQGPLNDPINLGEQLARRLISQGALHLLKQN